MKQSEKKPKIDVRKKCMYVTLPNGETVYIDWSIESEGTIIKKTRFVSKGE